MTIWAGKYNFNEEAGEIIKEKIIEFEMHIKVDDGSFSGRFIDQEYELLSELEVKVNGFFDENYVSFVVTYPYRRLYLADGTPVLQPDSINSEVTYYGEFEEDSQKISGNWEIIHQTHVGTLGVNVAVVSGPFEMEEKTP